MSWDKVDIPSQDTNEDNQMAEKATVNSLFENLVHKTDHLSLVTCHFLFGILCFGQNFSKMKLDKRIH
jgi:hypothetical protein